MVVCTGKEREVSDVCVFNRQTICTHIFKSRSLANTPMAPVATFATVATRASYREINNERYILIPLSPYRGSLGRGPQSSTSLPLLNGISTGCNNIEMGGPEDATSKSQVQERFLSSDGKPIRVPKIPLADFCQEYGINENIQRILASEGFETAGAILEISETGLKDTLKIGEIGELRRALREFISKELLDGAQ
ncbi:hypothetical protein DFH09DRAFT_1400526 [Mycena vulgaris]|nr:hypothetical protein DFH09DRAFT_1400526 [Mycena vulgaris]